MNALQTRNYVNGFVTCCLGLLVLAASSSVADACERCRSGNRLIGGRISCTTQQKYCLPECPLPQISCPPVYCPPPVVTQTAPCVTYGPIEVPPPSTACPVLMVAEFPVGTGETSVCWWMIEDCGTHILNTLAGSCDGSSCHCESGSCNCEEAPDVDPSEPVMADFPMQAPDPQGGLKRESVIQERVRVNRNPAFANQVIRLTRESSSQNAWDSVAEGFSVERVADVRVNVPGNESENWYAALFKITSDRCTIRVAFRLSTAPSETQPAVLKKLRYRSGMGTVESNQEGQIKYRGECYHVVGLVE